MPPPPADPPAWRQRSRLARALLARADVDTPRQLAERRIGHPVLAAAPLVRRRLWGAPERVLLALTDETVYVLALRDHRPLALRVGGVLEALPRTELVAHWTPRLGRVRTELSWPHHARLLQGDLRPGPATDQLIGHLAADEFTRQPSQP